ncbi:hypothetical protein F2Q68_00039325 [Brassica cretica]|uniref:Uncharacterized protein n=1 Tax=Brassica cretica TaxID=69181 RepID=A0A8S9MNL9_BRACR|nr:hypothetical protein F2Q68_00039325 [Brassica cretica]
MFLVSQEQGLCGSDRPFNSSETGKERFKGLISGEAERGRRGARVVVSWRRDVKERDQCR